MIHKWSTKGRKNILVLIGTACLLLFFPGLTLSACFNANVNCSGIDVACTYPTSTPNLPAIAATANALGKSKPLVTDSLKKQDKNDWDDDNHCFFHNGTYVDTFDGPSSLYGCNSNALHYGNAAIQVDVTLLSGYAAGVLFRNTPSLSEVYDFEITNEGQFDLQIIAQNSSPTFLIPVTASSAVQAVGKRTGCWSSPVAMIFSSW